MLNILHITEAGGGVLEIIKNLIEIDSKNHHILLARRRDFSSQTIERSDLNFEVYFWDGHSIRYRKRWRGVRSEHYLANPRMFSFNKLQQISSARA